MAPSVLISGASIAGPTLAFWLARAGYAVTVVEQAPAVRPGGYAVDFRGTGTKVLEAMGLAEAVRARQTRTGSITMVDARGRVVAKLPDGFTSGELEILRGDLAELLYTATRDWVEYVFGDSIAAIEDTGDAVAVTFGSGASRRFDLVVGADGLHSQVRRLIFGPEEACVRHMGYYLAIFTVPDTCGLGDAGRYYTEVGRRVSLFGQGRDGKAKASFYFAGERLDHAHQAYERRDVAAQKQLLREVFAGVGWEAPGLLAQMDQAPDFYFDALAQVKIPAWSRGRVVLLGDAASCAAPTSGMGTSIAMVGAYVLAGELAGSGGDHAAAFAQFEQTMRPFVDAAQKMAESVSWFVPKTRWKLWMSRQMWKHLPAGTLRKLMIEQPTRVASLVPFRAYPGLDGGPGAAL